MYMNGNIKMGLKETENKSVNWIRFFQDIIQWRIIVNMVMGLKIPQKDNDLLKSSVTIGYSRTNLFQVDRTYYLLILSVLQLYQY
jgi:hypothetical protein